MKTNAIKRARFVLLSCLVTLGCEQSSTDLPLLISQRTPQTIRPAIDDTSSEALSETDLDGSLSLPFVERENPFLFPHDKIDQVLPAATAVNEVRVLGFIHVDQPRVLLRISSFTRTLPVGGTAQGVEVVAIEPPTVRLRQGNLSWNASLFD